MAVSQSDRTKVVQLITATAMEFGEIVRQSKLSPRKVRAVLKALEDNWTVVESPAGVFKVTNKGKPAHMKGD